MMSQFEEADTSPDLPIPYSPVANPAQLEDLREQLNRALATMDDSRSIAYAHANLAGIAYALGDGASAVHNARAAFTYMLDSSSLAGYTYTTYGAALCFMGQYQEGCRAFDQAEAIVTRREDALGMAWQQHLVAREFVRDSGDHAQALGILSAALLVLRARATPQAIIENLLTQADCMLNLGEVRRAREVLKQAEEFIADHKNTWYRPELYLMRAQLAIREANYRQGWQFCYTGLGAVSDASDLRTLTPLYLSLATALEHDRDRIDDARDALERAINAGRIRARLLHLALSLRQIGLHLKRFSNRPTARARGSGYLFEADRLFQSMGLKHYLPSKAAAL